jgi:hypothetical protein
VEALLFDSGVTLTPAILGSRTASQDALFRTSEYARTNPLAQSRQGSQRDFDLETPGETYQG